jgi:hypothetical protein
MQELIKIQSELKAPKGQFNGFGKYKYRSLEDIMEAVKPLLADNGCYVTVSDDVQVVADRIYVKATATITNAKGVTVSTTAFAREPLDKKGMDASQITGMASSYARKYAMNGLFAIDDTKDADHETNHNDYQKPAPKKQAPQKPAMPLDQAQAILETATNAQELMQAWKQIGADNQKQLTKLKDELKAKFIAPKAVALPADEYNEMNQPV